MTNLSELLLNQRNKVKPWKTYPILLKWIESDSMQKEINVISSKVDYLLSVGAKAKVKEWISNDQALTQITAERYILDSLRKKNSNFEDSFTGGGVDGYLITNKSRIGLEVTTINQALPEWMLIERLLIYLAKNNYRNETGIEISYNLSQLEGIKYDNLDIIEKIGSRILTKNFHEVDGISIKKISKMGSYISWNNTNSDDTFFTDSHNSLSKIVSDKSKQLKKNQQNILFVCVNQLPNSVFNPGIFKEIGGKIYHPDWIEELKKTIQETLPLNVLGVCFFVYTLSSEEMMYPLQILWRDSKSRVPINL